MCKFFCILTTFLFFVACKNFEVEQLPNNILTNSTMFYEGKSIVIPTSDIKYSSVKVISDSLIILEKDLRTLSRGNDILSLYNIKTQKLRPLFKYGADEDSYLSMNLIDSGDSLLFYDFIKFKLSIASKSEISTCDTLIPHSVNFLVQYLQVLGDSLLLLNPYCFEYDGVSYNNQSRVKYACLNSNEDSLWGNNKYFTINAARGFFCFNKILDRLLYFDYRQNLIEVYSLRNLSLKKKVLGPGPDSSSIVVINNGKFKSILYSSKVASTYTDISWNDSVIVASYSGQQLVDDSERELFSSYLLVFDWDGKLLGNIKLDCHIKSVSLVNGLVYYYSQISKDCYCLKSVPVELILKSTESLGGIFLMEDRERRQETEEDIDISA